MRSTIPSKQSPTAFSYRLGPPRPALPEYLRIAQQELDRVTHITTQTLRFYRQSTRPVESDVNDLLDGVIALYEPRLRSLSIGVKRRYRDLPPVHAYDGEIRQVLANLSATPSTPCSAMAAVLLLRTARGRDPPTAVEGIYVTVADTGCGMDAATRPRSSSPSFPPKATPEPGLGLWVSQTIIDKHGGRISTRSRVRRRPNDPGGTVFRIFLPLQRPLGCAPITP